MSEPTPVAIGAPVPAAGKGLVNRLVGIIVSPRETFEDVVARPRWVGMLVLTTLTTAILLSAFFSTKVGQNAWIEESVRGQERWGRTPTEEHLAALEKVARFAPLFGIPVIVTVPLGNLILSGILFGVMKAVTGSQAAFKQAFAVVVHAGAVGVVQQVVTMPLNYLRGAMSGSTSLGVFLPVDEPSFLTALAGAIDLFLVWWLVVLAIGLSVLYKRRMGPIASVLLGLYAVIAVIIAAVFGSRGGG